MRKLAPNPRPKPASPAKANDVIIDWQEVVRLVIARLQDEGTLPRQTINSDWQCTRGGLALQWGTVAETETVQ